jgi:hypothetical protein
MGVRNGGVGMFFVVDGFSMIFIILVGINTLCLGGFYILDWF